MRTTKKALLGSLLAILMGAPAPMVFAADDGQDNAQDGMWLSSRCRSARLAFAVKQQKLQGHVKVRYDIQPNGRVTNIQVIDSDPPGVMDMSVKTAMRGWRYFAYIKDGVESGRKDVELTFTFGGPENEKADSCTHMPWPETTTAEAK